MVLVLVGCKEATSAKAQSSCKPLQSVWYSTANQEQHDFTNLQIDSPDWSTDYVYRGTGFEVCEDYSVVEAKIYSGDSSLTDYGFEYQLEIQNNNPPEGCGMWQDGTGSYYGHSETHASAVIKIECNKMTLCRTPTNNEGLCHEFN